MTKLSIKTSRKRLLELRETADELTVGECNAYLSLQNIAKKRKDMLQNE